MTPKVHLPWLVRYPLVTNLAVLAISVGASVAALVDDASTRIAGGFFFAAGAAAASASLWWSRRAWQRDVELHAHQLAAHILQRALEHEENNPDGRL